jgi:hypothetical protein
MAVRQFIVSLHVRFGSFADMATGQRDVRFRFALNFTAQDTAPGAERANPPKK